MSRENVEVVRQPISSRPHPRRRLDEQLGVRFPRAYVAFTKAMLRLSPGSRVRRALIRRAVETRGEATNRRDFESGFLGFHEECELQAPEGLVVLGSFPSRLRGRSERVRLEQRWRADWGEIRYEPDEVIDLADRLLILGRMLGTGVASGAAFDREWAALYTVSGGEI